jgi:hypothetical protein
MNTAKYAFDNGFGIGFSINKETKLEEWYVKCCLCHKQVDLPTYTKSAHTLGRWPWNGYPEIDRDYVEIEMFFTMHKCEYRP